MRKGIILAGGAGTRLHPLTKTTSKQLLPVYDKPMIYYPLTTLMLAGMRDILIITTPSDQQKFKDLLGDGSQFGISISYAAQEKPNGLAEAFIIGENFIKNEACSLILGDNLFYGSDLDRILQNVNKQYFNGATVFAYHVKNPQDYGVVYFDEHKNVVKIIEKPKEPESNYAVTGLYFYDNTVVEKAKTIKPSARGELEITDLNNLYIQEDKMQVETLGSGFAWLDTGSFDTLLQAGLFIQTLEQRQGIKIGCPITTAKNLNLIK
jgi:glucose-1-phosphate thymidylyltransferase